MNALLKFADVLLRWIHFVIIGFCLFGWLHPATRFYNLMLIGLIAFSWFGLGLIKGYGYCLVTDLQWWVKRKLGSEPTTSSFVKYELERLFNKNLSENIVNGYTQLGFYFASTATIVSNIS